jgi:hypothetical protein
MELLPTPACNFHTRSQHTTEPSRAWVSRLAEGLAILAGRRAVCAAWAMGPTVTADLPPASTRSPHGRTRSDVCVPLASAAGRNQEDAGA